MAQLTGLFVFLCVLFLYWGFRSVQNYKIHRLKSSLDGTFTVEEEAVERKRTIQLPFISRLYTGFKKAGFRIGYMEFILLTAVVAVMGYVVISYMVSSDYGWAGSLMALVFFRLWIQFRIKRRTLLMRGQFANALVRMANAMKAQVPLEEAVRNVSEKVAEPLQSELVRVYQYFLTERSMIKALKMVEEQIPLEEFRLFVISTEINQEIGGNLAELMEKLALTIGDKQEMDKKLQAYSVQGKNTATTIAVLPVFSFLFFKWVVPDFMAPFTTSSIGQFILLYCFCSIAFGWYYVRKMVDITLD